ncbi:MAG: ABC transporter ATP-binding protein [Christensenellaceae bacterium]|jgi:oligopeptide transport system ATP-binding protein|nr:ABC transporter ATP-binding protein [Christensenellaceae bacterium]
MADIESVLTIENLNISFSVFAGEVKAVRGVSFQLGKGETLAIVGESGSGKSVTARSIMGLLPNNAKITNGSILFKGEDLVQKSEKEMQKIRGEKISMIFQDPMTSLDPTMTIGNQVAESLRLHKKISRREALTKALELLELVGIPEAEKRMKYFPHQFSGGQRQRVVIAIALICSPEIVIADEPTTALDVTVQAQILELLKGIQNKLATSFLFITHNLGVVANIADRIAVIYAGRIVEIGTVEEVLFNPQHPYTWGLLSSMPIQNTNEKRIFAIPGTPPDTLSLPPGDAFYPRNKYAMKIDARQMPPLFRVSPTHMAATWLLAPGAPEVTPPAEVIRRRELFKERAAQAHASNTS